MMKITKKRLVEEIKKAIVEQSAGYSGMMGFSDGTEYVGSKTSRAYEKDKQSEESFEEFSGLLPQPRARVSDLDSYNPVYSFLMGHPGAATGMPLKEIMKKTEAGDPMSAAQAVADYLADRARIK